MRKYAFNPEGRTSRAFGRGLRISGKSSLVVCRKVTGMRSDKATQLLRNMVSQKQSLDGKFYTNASKEVLNLIESAEKNADSIGLDTEKLYVHASAHKGFSFFRPRGWKRRREQRKVTNLQVVLVER
jgi:ribosomal protein L22